MSLMEEEPFRSEELEEGQLSDSDGYTPLERPADYSKAYATTRNENGARMDGTDESGREPSSSSSSSSSSEGSSSDSDRPKPKKRKVKIKRLKRSDSAEATKANKYRVWCETVRDTLADDFLVCDVNKSRYLGIESYHHRFNASNNCDEEPQRRDMDVNSTDKSSEVRFNNKRRYRDRRNATLRLERRHSFDSDNERGNARHIPDLAVNAQNSVAEVADDIATKLSEQKDSLILRIVENAGREKAIEIFKETKRIEQDGGMIVRNGTRRRTPGGVFIFLLKRDKDISQEITNKIFLEDKLEDKERNRNQNRNLNKYRDKKFEEIKTLFDRVGNYQATLRQQAEKWAAENASTEDLLNNVSNPPPSPATDGRDGSSDVDTNQYDRRASDSNNFLVSRETAPLPGFNMAKNLPTDPRASSHTTYDDDYLDIGHGDDMDLF